MSDQHANANPHDQRKPETGRTTHREESITPIDFTPANGEPNRRGFSPRPWQLVVAALFSLLLGLLLFLFSAHSVEITLNPSHASYHIDGVQIPLAGRHLMLSGDHTLYAEAEGYQPLSTTFSVSEAKRQHTVTLQKQPGLLQLDLTPTNAHVAVDGGEPVAVSEQPLRLEAGVRQLTLSAERYLPLTTEVEMIGLGKTQHLNLTLQPAWAEITLDSSPSAEVALNGEPIGETPLTAEILQGEQTLTLRRDGYQTHTETLAVIAGEAQSLPTIVLQKALAELHIDSTPSGASVLLDDNYQGRTPLTVAVEPNRAVTLTLFKAGHQRTSRTVTLESGAQEQLNLPLNAEQGSITIVPTPSDAEILVDGRLIGRGTQRLTLPAIRHTITARRSGYGEHQQSVIPKPGHEQRLTLSLQTLEALKWQQIPTTITSSLGQTLKLMRPTQPFTMGASRREPGRRANEALREVTLKRPFYIAEREVTNAEFRRFRADHNSGNLDGRSLNGEQQPAVNLSWDEAARFCNWLSQAEGLPNFYREEGGKIVGFDPASSGYRLPSEAEWAWSARTGQEADSLRFPWGSAMPPKAKSGNYADQSAAPLLSHTLPNYQDGYAVSAPVAQYPANVRGLYDLGGNVAEWVHDFYGSVAALLANRASDPLGPEQGEFHVIRGASWQHASQVELRLSFRDYGNAPRRDVGFRIARYLE